MDFFVVSPLVLGVLFLVAVLAAFIDSIAGGGGLLTVPSLLAAGLSPAQALATNKLQSVGGSFSASLYFVRRGAVKLREQRLNIAMTFIGAVCGTVLIQHIQADVLRQILPILLISIGLWFLLMPRLGESDREHRLQGFAYALVGGGCVGFLRRLFRAGRRFILCIGVRDAVRIQSGESHCPRQSLKFHFQLCEPTVLYVRRESGVGYRRDHADWRILWCAPWRKAGAEPRPKAYPPDGGHRLRGDER